MDIKMMAFACLDPIKEKLENWQKGFQQPYQGKINHMFAGDCEISFFGFLTGNGFKYIVGIKQSSTLEEESTQKVIKDMFRSMYRYTLAHFQNPFLDEETEEEFKQ